MLLTLFDGLLVVGLLGLASAVVSSSDLHKSIVLYIVFGLLMALAWIRLQAPDVALAEAAIGAGLTGALFLSSYRRLSEAKSVKSM
jgi:energy-converting hydrogenase B subunit D